MSPVLRACLILWINSVPSSIIVKSALKFVSNTLSKPNLFKAECILPLVTVPGSMPNSSPMATLTAGAS